MLAAEKVRQTFIDFFKGKQHTEVDTALCTSVSLTSIACHPVSK